MVINNNDKKIKGTVNVGNILIHKHRYKKKNPEIGRLESALPLNTKDTGGVRTSLEKSHQRKL